MDLLDKVIVITNCLTCEGKGIHSGWVSPDGDFDFEWCDCNPDHLIVGDEF